MHSKQTKEFAKAHADGCCRDEPAGVPHQISEGVGLSVASPPILRLCCLPFPCLMFLLSAHYYLEHVYVCGLSLPVMRALWQGRCLSRPLLQHM